MIRTEYPYILYGRTEEKVFSQSGLADLQICRVTLGDLRRELNGPAGISCRGPCAK